MIIILMWKYVYIRGFAALGPPVGGPAQNRSPGVQNMMGNDLLRRGNKHSETNCQCSFMRDLF